jgi:Ca2+-binding EF-hand superfamily protein
MKRVLTLILTTGAVVASGCGTVGAPMLNRTAAAPAPAVRSQSVAGIRSAIVHLSESEFFALDANKDGSITLTESKMTTADFAKVDANGDGQITKAEQSAYYDWISEGLVEFLHEESAKNIVSFDRNVDGFVSIEEFRATLPQDPYNDHTRFAMGMFNTSDVNHDRRMDLSEFEDYEAWFIASLYDLDGISASGKLAKAKQAAMKRTKTKKPAIRR